MTIEERNNQSKITIRLGRIADSLELIAMNLNNLYELLATNYHKTYNKLEND